MAKTERAAGKAGRWRIVNRVQLAALMGVHPDRVTHYAREGMPVKKAGGRGAESEYDAVACLEWLRERQGVSAKELAQAKSYGLDAELKQTKLEEMRGSLWSKEAITLAGVNLTKSWAAAVRSIPSRLTVAGLIQRQQEPAVSSLLRDLLREITAWKPPTEDVA